MKISEKGLKLTKQFEGIRLAPYKDVRGIATIGFGSTFYLDGTPVKITDKKITMEQAETLLQSALNALGEQLNKLVIVHINQNQIDALLDFTYNIGIGAFSKSTLLKTLNEGKIEEAGKCLLSWQYAGGNVVQGLIKRREAELNLFRS